MSEKPEIWGGGCECWVTPEHLWTTHYGAVEPGSQLEFNPECPKHGYDDPAEEDWAAMSIDPTGGPGVTIRPFTPEETAALNAIEENR